MCRIRLAIVAFLLATIGLQAQEGFYYQAVIKNTDGSPLKETPVKIRIRIIEGTTTLQYEEEKEVTTSREGFVSFIIGEGATTDFTSINWQGELYLQDEIDTGAGYGAPTRMPLLKTPRSYISDRAISVLDNSITSASILDGTISNDDISAAASISFSKLSISASDIEGLGFLQSDENFTSALKDKLDGVEAGANAYSLPTATSDVLGGVKVGTGITIADGVISADTQSDVNFTSALKDKLDGVEAGANAYSLPTATSDVLGGVKVGTGITIADGVVAIGQAVGTADDVQFNKVTADLIGDVTGTVSEISNHIITGTFTINSGSHLGVLEDLDFTPSSIHIQPINALRAGSPAVFAQFNTTTANIPPNIVRITVTTIFADGSVADLNNDVSFSYIIFK